jgi:hypothetical protein
MEKERRTQKDKRQTGESLR